MNEMSKEEMINRIRTLEAENKVNNIWMASLLSIMEVKGIVSKTEYHEIVHAISEATVRHQDITEIERDWILQRVKNKVIGE